ncbi:hypothetical protein GCM10009601_48540 [Streptomyces thermospinosisporus]|uniref:Uncharacterized protein n=1 Tax=Streptomyces thermospinosisporus TaxID=161482 RepID=A0ABN1Z3X2_9ACTN
MSPPASGDADTTISPTPTASPSASSRADDDATALEQYWTPERMADAVPVEEEQERTTRTSSSARKGVQTSPSHYFEGIKEVGTFYWDERRSS